MDRRRIALVRGGEETGFCRIGSGYLVAPRLVLTARHVVEEGPGAAWPRLDVRVGHPQGDTRRCGASVCWTHPGSRDVALLLLDDSVGVPGFVRWGRPVGNDPLPYDALGFPSTTTRNGKHNVEHLRGELPPLGAGVGIHDRYVLDQGPSPGVPADGSKAWSGASGSAVFCGDYLVGVIIHDDEAFENRRLHACPTRSFIREPGFADMVERHGCERPRLVLVEGHSTSDDMERYLRAARLAAAEQPYPGVVPGTRLPLSRIYMSRQIVRQMSPPMDRGEETGLGVEAPLAASPPQPADEVLTGDGICLVVGVPGGGKSSLLRTLLTHGVEKWRDDFDEVSPAPVLVPAAALLGVPLSMALVSAVNAHLPEYGLTTGVPHSFFEGRPGPGRRWLVLVDGLDEITSPGGREAVLRTVANAGDEYAFIVATRPVSESELGVLGQDVPRYRLALFGSDELERVVTGWFRALKVTEPAGRYLSVLSSAGMTDLARVPLTMAMLCQLRAVFPSGRLPRGRGELYGRFVEMVYQHQRDVGVIQQARAAMNQYGAEAETRAEETVRSLDRMLTDLAYRLRFVEHADRSALDIVRKHECAERPADVPKRHWHEFLESILCSTGLLTRHSDDVVFTHQTFVEYFAARHVVEDEERLRTVFQKSLLRSARHVPRRRLPPGVTVRLWLSRYWKPPPPYDPITGFILDITPEDHVLKNEFLSRMASQRAGIDGYEFLALQVSLGTALPEDILRSTVSLLRQAAFDESMDGYDRVHAATVLARIDNAGGASLFRALAYDRTLNSINRHDAAKYLTQGSPADFPRVFSDLAQDQSMHSADRLIMTLQLTRADPATALQCLRALAYDDRAGSLERLVATNKLREVDPAGQAELLRTLVLDATLTLYARRWAAANLDPGPDEATELLEQLTRDPTMNPGNRSEMAEILLRRFPRPPCGG